MFTKNMLEDTDNLGDFDSLYTFWFLLCVLPLD